MAVSETMQGGHSGARDLRVWDPLVRLVHWSVALGVLVNSFADPEKTLHEWVGYIAVGLVVIRLVWGLVGPRPARFTSFPPDPVRALRYLGAVRRGDRTVHLSHNPLGALMVYNLWATVAALGVTGYMMGTMAFFGVSWVEQAHELAYNWLLLSVALHVAGILFDTWRSGVPLAVAMITGRKRIPEGREIE